MERGSFLELIGAIQEELDETAGEGAALVFDEQAFMKLGPNDLDDRIYVAVRFGAATTNYGQTSLPISLICCGFKNRADEMKTILVEFALRNNLRDDKAIAGEYCLQLYNTPSAIQNFSEAGDGFTSLFAISGYAVFGSASNRIARSEYIYEEEGGTLGYETIKATSVSLSLNVVNNTQPKLSTDGIATSVGQYGTLSVSMSTYLVESRLASDLLSICSAPSAEAMNKAYRIKLTMSDGTVIDHEWRLVAFAPSQALGSLPMATMTFTM